MQDPKAPVLADLSLKVVVARNTHRMQSRGVPFVLNPRMHVLAEIGQRERPVMECLLSTLALKLRASCNRRPLSCRNLMPKIGP